MNFSKSLANLAGRVDVYDAPFGADIIAFVSVVRDRNTIGVYVAKDEMTAHSVAQIAAFVDPSLEILRFPAWDCLPYDRVSPTPAVSAQRCATLAALAQQSQGHARLVVTTGSAVAQRTPPVETLRSASLVLSTGETVNEDALTQYLSVNGYVRVPTVREKGDYAIRGGIIDIFPPQLENPVRLDFFGDTLEGLKQFDVESQRSVATLKVVNLAPVSEILFSDRVLSEFRTGFLERFGPPAGDAMYEAARSRIRQQGIEFWLPLFHTRLDTLFDYLPRHSIVGLGHLSSEAATDRFLQSKDYFSARVEAAGDVRQAKVVSPEELFISGDGLEKHFEHFDVFRFSPRNIAAGTSASSLGARYGRDFGSERATGANVFDTVIDHVRSLRTRFSTVAIAAWTEGSADRLKSVLSDHGLQIGSHVYSLDAAVSVQSSIVVLPLEQGIEFGDLCIVSEQDILGERLARPRRSRKASNFISELSSLSAGDIVVHVEHGVGRYLGLRTVEVGAAPHDCLELQYAGGDKLFLPVENIELVSRYGSDSAETQIDRLGGTGWQTRKAKAKKRILEMAEDLIRIAAERELRKGEVVSGADGYYQEFAARFPYEETDDQLRAIEDAISDLKSGKPMDRLVCGDVGFGKTEVALRTAFVAAMTGLQVAVIAPTTLLARQHFTTFKDRFKGWPINVAHLSRLVPAKRASETRAKLKSGECDVVIGTHALLAKSVEFKKLGLLVIDEEQRFGVKHKERLKELKSDVHVLTLSATPIPRTLQLALTGIRDLSIIATPPIDRLAVRTYVSEFDALTIREALLRERYRGGQSFFVTPKIADLPKLEAFLKDAVPEVSFVAAHGQMTPTELEDIMSAFYEGEFDVLLSTTIVESGLDIPRANTLIVNRADMFGLAQLYQLRGRVGRSKMRAYAYLTTPKNEQITDSAEKRLRVLQSLDSLGAGFMLASHDLDMRGGGNLLGDQQSGHVREVGVELYQSMLEEAVSSLRSGAMDIEDDWSPQINLGLAVLIPEDYVEDLTVRLSLYRRLADIDTPEEREAFAAELIDRFGPVPDETKQLIEIAAIKADCKKLGVAKLDAGPKGAVVAFRENAPVDAAGLIRFVQQDPNRLKLRPDHRLVVSGHWNSSEQKARAVKGVLSELVKLINTD